MGVLAPLVPDAQPAYFGGGVNAKVTEGRDWEFPPLMILDADGNPVTLTGVTGVCTVWDAASGASVITLDVNVGTDSIVYGKAAASTGGKAAGKAQGRRCKWGLKLTDGTDTIDAWGPFNSVLIILDESEVV